MNRIGAKEIDATDFIVTAMMAFGALMVVFLLGFGIWITAIDMPAKHDYHVCVERTRAALIQDGYGYDESRYLARFNCEEAERWE